MTYDELRIAVARSMNETPPMTRFDFDKGYHVEDYGKCIDAILAVIYEALKEPSEGMIVASDLPDYRAVELWHALLSASPLSDKGERR